MLCKCVTLVIHAPRSEEACFVLNFPAILNLIWSGHPPFIGACEQRFPMNILLQVHYAMHILYSQPTRFKVDWPLEVDCSCDCTRVAHACENFFRLDYRGDKGPCRCEGPSQCSEPARWSDAEPLHLCKNIQGGGVREDVAAMPH